MGVELGSGHGVGGEAQFRGKFGQHQTVNEAGNEEGGEEKAKEEEEGILRRGKGEHARGKEQGEDHGTEESDAVADALGYALPQAQEEIHGEKARGEGAFSG